MTISNPDPDTCECANTHAYNTHTYKHTMGTSMNSKFFSPYCKQLAMEQWLSLGELVTVN